MLAMFISALVLPAHAAAPELLGLWQGQGFIIAFSADGHYQSSYNGQPATGQWTVAQGVLQTATNGIVYQYGYQISGDQLHLQDPSGAVLQLQRQNATPRPARQPQENTQPMSRQEWLAFLEQYPSMTPDQVGARMMRLTADMATMLSVFDALRADILFQVCQGSYAQQVTVDGGCGAIIQNRQQSQALAAQFGMTLTEHNTQRQQVANAVRCELGLIDQGTCQAANQFRQNYTEMSNQTARQIIENMRPPPCTQYFDENNSYLGCW